MLFFSQFVSDWMNLVSLSVSHLPTVCLATSHLSHFRLLLLSAIISALAGRLSRSLACVRERGSSLGASMMGEVIRA